MWNRYDNLTEVEFQKQVNKKCNELSKLYQELDDLRVKLYNQYANSFDLLNFFDKLWRMINANELFTQIADDIAAVRGFL